MLNTNSSSLDFLLSPSLDKVQMFTLHPIYTGISSFQIAGNNLQFLRVALTFSRFSTSDTGLMTKLRVHIPSISYQGFSIFQIIYFLLFHCLARASFQTEKDWALITTHAQCGLVMSDFVVQVSSRCFPSCWISHWCPIYLHILESINYKAFLVWNSNYENKWLSSFHT